MRKINIFDLAGAFAENKDVARDIRVQQIIPTLDQNQEVILDFEKVDAVTQSFIHALISDVFRKYGNDVLDRIAFKSCNEKVRKIIGIVTEYMQEGL